MLLHVLPLSRSGLWFHRKGSLSIPRATPRPSQKIRGKWKQDKGTSSLFNTRKEMELEFGTMNYVLHFEKCQALSSHLTDGEVRLEEVNNRPRAAAQVTGSLGPRSVAIVTTLLCCCFVPSGGKTWAFLLWLDSSVWDHVEPKPVVAGGKGSGTRGTKLGSSSGWESLSRSVFLWGF